jgi:hypothetical protein
MVGFTKPENGAPAMSGAPTRLEVSQSRQQVPLGSFLARTRIAIKPEQALCITEMRDRA